jgi:hypothetical protein
MMASGIQVPKAATDEHCTWLQEFKFHHATTVWSLQVYSETVTELRLQSWQLQE